MSKDDAVSFVKKRLWNNHFSVEDFSKVDTVDYDLLVDGEFHVYVNPGKSKHIEGDAVIAIVQKEEVNTLAYKREDGSDFALFKRDKQNNYGRTNKKTPDKRGES